MVRCGGLCYARGIVTAPFRAPGLEWYIPGLEIDLYSRVWLFRMVRPIQQGTVKETIQKLGFTDVNEGNVMPIDPEKFTPDQKKDFDAVMQQARDQFLNSFMQTRKGTLVQKYKLKVFPDDPRTSSSNDGEGKQAPDGLAQPSDKNATEGFLANQGDNLPGVHGVQGDGSQGVQGGGVNQDSNTAQLQFNNFQDQVDYDVHHALINQSGILTNILANMVKSMVDGSMAEYQATGPVYLPGGVFPNYQPLITNNQPVVQSIPLNAPSAQPTAPASTPAPAAPPSAPGQLVNPQLLVREQPQHAGQNVNRLTQDQVASMFLHPQHTIDPTQQQPIQHTPSRQQVVQPIQQTPPVQQVVQPVQQTPPRQQILQPIQQTPLRQQVVQPIQQQGPMNASAGSAIPGGQPVQHVANQVVLEHLVHHVQPDGTVIPQVIPEHLVRNIQPDIQNYQGGNLNYQYQPPSPHIQNQQAGSVSHPDFRFRIYKLFNKLIIEFILNVH
uniref:Retrotransposon protein, putative, unclassified n=1 Tax=Oryza sativa subsp. japonica TaxID=39947 RepID=Q2R8S6_ORYSJ|nr:retrotransposon protein, putative, unclassified [Oryza sativa Japonica Group]